MIKKNLLITRSGVQIPPPEPDTKGVPSGPLLYLAVEDRRI